MNVRILFAPVFACLLLNAANDVIAQDLSEADAADRDGLVPGRTSHTGHEPVDAQWAPHSTTVVTAEELESTYRPDLEHIEGMVPGLIVDRMHTTPRGAAIAIRGVGSSGASKAFDPAVAVNIDGVYVGTHTGRLQVLFDFEQIEVVRGPQGVADGNPNLAGSVNIQRTRPTGEFDIDLRASMGIDDRREMDAVINFPIVDTLKGKIAIYRKDKGGEYMTNVFSDRDENTEDFTLASATLAWEFRDWFSMLYTIDSERSDETTPALLNISAPVDLLCASTTGTAFPNCRRGSRNPELDSLKTTAQNFSNDREFNGDYHTLRMDFDVANHTIRTITGLRDTDETSDMDLDASNSSFYHVSQSQDYEQFSQEITILGNYSETLSYAFGLYFLNTEYRLTQQEFHILNQLGDAGFTEGHDPAEIQELASEQKSNLQSMFASINYVIDDQWTADLGLRWSQVEREFRHSPSRIRLGANLSPLRTFLVGEETTKEALISGGVAYKVDEEASIYARYSQGFLPGGFDENAMSAFSGNSYGAETVRSVEIGLKSDWWDDRLRVNLAYYNMQVDNKVERFDTYTPDGQIESILDNVSEIDVSGWELDVESTPLENLYLRFVWTKMNPDYTRYDVTNLANGGVLELTELRPQRAPDDNLFFSANYSFQAGPGRIHTYAGYRLFSDYQTNPILPEADVTNWTSWDLSVGYEYREWMFRLFSNNVKNKEFAQNIHRVTQTDILPVTSGTTVPSLITLTEYNQPRYTGLEIIYRPDFSD